MTTIQDLLAESPSRRRGASCRCGQPTEVGIQIVMREKVNANKGATLRTKHRSFCVNCAVAFYDQAVADLTDDSPPEQ